MRRAGGRSPHVLAVLVVSLTVGTACSKDVAANDLEPGDCVVDEETLNRADIEAIDCDEAHVFELIGKFDVDDQDEYPGETELTDEGTTRCQGDIFQEYVGVPFVESADIYVTPVPPSEETWDGADDRTILCFAHTQDLAETTGSVEGSEG